MFGLIARLARPLVVLKLMNWKRVFICTPPPASALSSTSPLFCALLSRISVASPVAAALRATMPTELLGTTAICSSRGLSTCTPLLPPERLRKGRLASRAITPFTHQHALGPAGDGQHAGHWIAAQQWRPQVALDLLRGGDGAAAREGPGGGRGADEELGEIRRGGVERPVRPDGDVLLQSDAAGGEAGQHHARAALCILEGSWWLVIIYYSSWE